MDEGAMAEVVRVISSSYDAAGKKSAFHAGDTREGGSIPRWKSSLEE